MPIILCIEGVQAGLRVVFERGHDRYAHRIEWYAAASEAQPLLESVEGDAEEMWPASPVIQDVHLEWRDDGSRVALCVGKAGKSHWSLAVRLDADGRKIVFQAACRVREVPGNLSSVYRMDHEKTDADWQIQALPPTLYRTEIYKRILMPAEFAQTAPQTVTWEYAISVESEEMQKKPLG